MIKHIRLASDIHLEFGSDPDLSNNEFPVEESVLLLAGDITNASSDVIDIMADYLEKLTPDYHKILMVMGNHEYYDGKRDSVLPKLRKAIRSMPNVELLQETSWVHEDLVVHGATMWTDFAGGDHVAMTRAAMEMNDYHLSDLTPTHVFDEHVFSRDWLRKQIEVHGGKRQIVMTHHVPSEAVVHPSFKGHYTNPNYRSSDLDGIISDAETHGVKLWVFGHSHASMDVEVADIRFVANPYGYERYEENPEFEFKKWLTV